MRILESMEYKTHGIGRNIVLHCGPELTGRQVGHRMLVTDTSCPEVQSSQQVQEYVSSSGMLSLQEHKCNHMDEEHSKSQRMHEHRIQLRYTRILGQEGYFLLLSGESTACDGDGESPRKG